MARWTREEEEKLLHLYQTGHTYEELAEALGRSTGSVIGKLYRVKEKRKETQGPIYRGEGGSCTEEVPEAEEIYNKLVLALLHEFDNARISLAKMGRKHIKHKPGLYNNLVRMAEALIKLLKTKPDQASIEEWWDKISSKEACRAGRRVLSEWIRKRKLSKRSRTQ